MKKQKIRFVATRYKDKPAKIDYYTEDGRIVDKIDKELEKLFSSMEYFITHYDEKRFASFLMKKLKEQKETLYLEYDKQYLKREEKLIKKYKKKIEEMIYWINDWESEGQPYGVKGLIKRLNKVK